MSDRALHIHGVGVAYTGRKVISDITLDVKRGETFGLMGLNGAGKTTLIKCILGLREQDEGEISIYDTPRSSKESKASLAYLPEKFEPPWFLTGVEFLRFSLRLYKETFDRERVLSAARALALEEAALGRRVHTYSKGMRQKLGLLGTMLTGCSLFILDEPMSGLDPLARSQVKRMILDAKNKEKTVFLSSHILADMDELCDRVAVLHEGKIQYVGTPKALKEKTSADNLERAFLDYIENTVAA